jgi:general secretion pathway protein D
MGLPRTTVRAALFALVAAAAPAQETEYFTFSLQAEGMPLETLLSQAEAATGKSFVYNDAAALKGKTVKMLGTVKIPKAKVFGFFQALLVSQGYALVPLGDEKKGLYQIENIEQARMLKQRAPFVHVDNLADYRNEVGKVIMTTVPLKYANAVQIKAAVSQLLANRNAELVQEITTANSIMILAFAPTVFAVKQIIDAMDVPQPAANLIFDIVELKHAVAEELQPIISDLIKEEVGAGARRPAVNPETGVAGAEKPEPKLIADPRTNALVVYAVQSDVDEIKRLVAALDVEVTDADNPIRVFMLKNTDAADMEEVLRDVLQQGLNSRGSRPSGVRAGNNQGPTSTSSSAQEVSIVADINNNALLITASKTRYAEIEPIIRQLDRRRPQVLVQAAIVELSDSDLRNVGVELTGLQGGDNDFMFGGATGFGLSTVVNSGTGTGTGTGGTGTGTGGGAGTGAVSGLNNLVRVPFLATGTGGASSIDLQGGVFGLFDDGLNIPILVQMLKTRTQSNLMSVPSVLTNDNEGSRIRAGRSIATASTQNTLGGATGTTFGGYQEAVIELIITPSISNDNYLRLEVEILVEAFVGTRVSAQIPPDRTQRRLLGKVTVPNARTLVVGGLVQDNDNEVERAVPFLSDIPLLGELFKKTDTTKEKTTLYVFVTPTIVEDFARLDEISDERKLEVLKLDGQIRLIDPHFRARGLEDMDLSIKNIEDSGALEVPRYAPTAPSTPAPASKPADGGGR